MKLINRVLCTIALMSTCLVLTGCTLTMAVGIAPRVMLSGVLDRSYEQQTWMPQEWVEFVEEVTSQGLSQEEISKAVDDRFGASSSSSSSSPSATPVPTCKHEWYEEVTKASTCVEKGEMTKTCLNCGEVKTSAIDKVDHDYQPGETVESTCIEAGKITEVCSVCGEINEIITEALGHDYGTEKEVTIKATCDTEGLEAYVCKRCGEVKDETAIEAIGHNEETVVVKTATFFVEGKEQSVCKDCNVILSENDLPATGGVFRFVLPVGSFVILAGIASVVILKRRK